jgi:uncharacterized membrane protein (UPF0127 family)
MAEQKTSEVYVGDGYTIERKSVETLLIRVMPGAVLPTKPWETGYVIVPWQDATFMRVTLSEGKVIKQEPVPHKAHEPFYVEPQAKGHTLVMQNIGGKMGIFQKIVIPEYPEPTAPQAEILPRQDLIINSVVSGKLTATKFQVEVATVLDQWAIGLGFRDDIKPENGMLFDWGKPLRFAMNAKYMKFSVDRAYIGKDGKIFYMSRQIIQGDDKPEDAGKPARAVLELKAGTLDMIQAKIDDKVDHKIFP